MTLARMTFLVAMAACTGSALHAQEQTTPGSVPSDQAGWQKQCEDKANLDKLAAYLHGGVCRERQAQYSAEACNAEVISSTIEVSTEVAHAVEL
jgi:invasion protein IalB